MFGDIPSLCRCSFGQYHGGVQVLCWWLCVVCVSTSNTHRLFCMPMNNNLRNLWMSLLVPTNPNLLGLTKKQLIKQRVCERHFDQTQFNQVGVRIRHSYPCLFPEMEIAHGVPLAKGNKFVDEHNYFQSREQDDESIGEPITLSGNISHGHQYSLPSTSHSVTSHLQTRRHLLEDAGVSSENTEFGNDGPKTTTQIPGIIIKHN